MSKAPLTDHCLAEITLNPTCRKKNNKGYWKFNTNLLRNKDYCSKIKEIINEIEATESINNICKKWEYVQYKVREFSIKFSKELNKKRQKEENNLFYEISQWCSRPELSSEDKEKLMKLQTQLDNIYCILKELKVHL